MLRFAKGDNDWVESLFAIVDRQIVSKTTTVATSKLQSSLQSMLNDSQAWFDSLTPEQKHAGHRNPEQKPKAATAAAKADKAAAAQHRKEASAAAEMRGRAQEKSRIEKAFVNAGPVRRAN